VQLLAVKDKISPESKAQEELAQREEEYSSLVKGHNEETLKAYLALWNEARLQGDTKSLLSLPPELQSESPLVSFGKGYRTPYGSSYRRTIKSPCNTNGEGSASTSTFSSSRETAYLPLRRLVCQEQVVQLFTVFPSNEAKWSQDLVRTLAQNNHCKMKSLLYLISQPKRRIQTMLISKI